MPPQSTGHLYVTYAHADSERVQPIVDAVRAEFRVRQLDVDLWMDVERLQAGARWNETISEALETATGLLVFISPASMQSEWVRREVEAVAADESLFILPVLLAPVANLPIALESIQWLDLTGPLDEAGLSRAASEIAEATYSLLRGAARAPLGHEDADLLGDELAREIRGRPEPSPDALAKNAVFIVHGHDSAALDEVEAFVEERGIEPVVLTRIGGPTQSLLQKFLQFSSDIRFAVVLLTADDLGASRLQYDAEGVGDRALQFRTRQNVILELGFFYGYLGWENVFVLYKEPSSVFPNFERPSDLDGVVFDKLDQDGQWQQLLSSRLAQAGFRVSTRPA